MSIIRVLRTVAHSFIDFVFPPQCLHCGERTTHEHPLFCPPCFSLLDLIDPRERCNACFNPLNGTGGKRCGNCREGHSIFTGVTAAFDYLGPAASLIKRLKYGNQPYLAKGAAAFLVAQWAQMEWPLPDALVPVPMCFMHRMDRGYNQSDLLAKEAGALLNIPVWDVLRRESGDFSQAALDLSRRKSLEGKRFKLKKNSAVAGKKLLLVDDVMTSGSTLRRCAEVLAEGYPSSIYAMTFCR